jgi:hypothetical protein
MMAPLEGRRFCVPPDHAASRRGLACGNTSAPRLALGGAARKLPVTVVPTFQLGRRGRIIDAEIGRGALASAPPIPLEPVGRGRRAHRTFSAAAERHHQGAQGGDHRRRRPSHQTEIASCALARGQAPSRYKPPGQSPQSGSHSRATSSSSARGGVTASGVSGRWPATSWATSPTFCTSTRTRICIGASTRSVGRGGEKSGPCRRVLLWADLDASHPRALDVEPTVAWSTSPRRFAALWVLNEVPGDTTRRAFNRLVRADVGGWHQTKLLRVPGSVNFKYDPPTPGRLLWDDGPKHKLRALRALLPAPRRVSSVPRRGPRRPMPRQVEQFLAHRPWKHGRSTALFFAVYLPLMRAGWSDEQIERAVLGTGWDKFTPRGGTYTLLKDIANSRQKLTERGELS